MYYKAHQKGGTTEEVGDALADREAKRVAETEDIEVQALIPDSKIQTEGKPRYSREDQKLIEDLGGQMGEGGWIRAQNKIIVPTSLLWAIIMAEHRKTHWGTEALYKYLSQQIVDWNLYTTIKQVTQQREICLQNNPRTGPKVQLGQIGKGNFPGQQWQIDFSELPRKGGCQNMLVLTNIFSGWTEAFPCRTNKV